MKRRRLVAKFNSTWFCWLARCRRAADAPKISALKYFSGCLNQQ
ncbi:hypothetical protein [Kingella sp. (in: b-proteobacteria)]|nr:hypothetical protein [Kingella sp. (in: b-proteobacteria)]MDO4657295.1 hypothetical protein [Kingella sp. (in: b-proteobacteria)]